MGEMVDSPLPDGPQPHWIYDADVYCAACTRAIKRRIRKSGGMPANPRDERSYDSGEWPKGPYDASDNTESDSPKHCGSGPDCLDPTVIGGERYGQFLANDLTSEGVRYLAEMHADPSEVTRYWVAYYRAAGYTIPES